MVQRLEDIRIYVVPASCAAILSMLAHKFMTMRKLLLLQPYPCCHTHQQDKESVNCLHQLILTHFMKKAKLFKHPTGDLPPQVLLAKVSPLCILSIKESQECAYSVLPVYSRKRKSRESAGNWCLGSNPIVSFPGRSCKPVIINLCHE